MVLPVLSYQCWLMADSLEMLTPMTTTSRSLSVVGVLGNRRGKGKARDGRILKSRRASAVSSKTGMMLLWCQFALVEMIEVKTADNRSKDQVSSQKPPYLITSMVARATNFLDDDNIMANIRAGSCEFEGLRS